MERGIPKQKKYVTLEKNVKADKEQEQGGI